ncbi:hypothetical protein K1Y78_41305 [Streptomyces sp. tea 10]|nr:hypothetical protein [Streptomyces sp. tea 10]
MPLPAPHAHRYRGRASPCAGPGGRDRHQDGRGHRLAHSPDAPRTLLDHAAEALHRLPADPALSLPAFAARVLGDAHASSYPVPGPSPDRGEDGSDRPPDRSDGLTASATE